MQPSLSATYPHRLPPSEKATTNRGLQALALLTATGLSLLVARGLLTHNWWFFIMLTWNLFLVWFPLGMVLVLRDLRAAGFQSRWLMGMALTTWLLFVPNAPYIITDLFHIKHIPEQLLWFDTMTLFLFALTGLLAGLYSNLLVHRMLRPQIGSLLTWALLISFQFMTGFGIYLGRFGRWNSWNILTKPWLLLNGIAQTLQETMALKLTLSYGFVLTVMYVAFQWYVAHDKRS